MANQDSSMIGKYTPYFAMYKTLKFIVTAGSTRNATNDVVPALNAHLKSLRMKYFNVNLLSIRLFW